MGKVGEVKEEVVAQAAEALEDNKTVEEEGEQRSLDDVVDAFDGVAPAEETAEDEGAEGESAEGAEGESAEGAEEESAEEESAEEESAEEEPEKDPENKGQWPEAAFQRIGKLKHQRETRDKRIEELESELTEVKSAASADVLEAARIADVDPVYISEVDAETVKQADKISRQIDGLKDLVEAGNGFQDEEKGIDYTHQQVLTKYVEILNAPKGSRMRQKAEDIRTAASEQMAADAKVGREARLKRDRLAKAAEKGKGTPAPKKIAAAVKPDTEKPAKEAPPDDKTKKRKNYEQSPTEDNLVELFE